IRFDMVAALILVSFSNGPIITHCIKKRCKSFYFLVICLFGVATLTRWKEYGFNGGYKVESKVHHNNIQ
ncbi:hypothetical protein, partial [Limnobacter sp.]|uniref:hypothetical protein n=1 Tax=Limnobacter sp. TaxID=2003368 RepID=UPI002732A929